MEGLSDPILDQVEGFREPNRELEQYFVNISKYGKIYDYLKKTLKGKDIQDLCCGTGGISIPLYKSIASAICIDIDGNVKETFQSNVELLPVQYRSKFTFINDDVCRRVLRDDVIVINPPFGDDTELLDPILEHLVRQQPQEIHIILPKDTLLEFVEELRGYFVRKYIPFGLKLGKTYKYHTKFSHTVVCAYAHLEKIVPDESFEIDPEYQLDRDRYVTLIRVQGLQTKKKAYTTPVSALMRFFTRRLGMKVDDTSGEVTFTVDGKENVNFFNAAKLVWDVNYSIAIDEEVFSKVDRIEITSFFFLNKGEMEIFNILPRTFIMCVSGLSIIIGFLMMSPQDIDSDIFNEKFHQNITNFMSDFNNVHNSGLKIPTNISFEVTGGFMSNLRLNIMNILSNQIEEIQQILSDMNSLARSAMELLEVCEIKNIHEYKIEAIKIKELYSREPMTGEQITLDFKIVVDQLQALYEEYSDISKSSGLVSYKTGDPKIKRSKEFRLKKRIIIQEFFNNIHITKLISPSGGVRGIATIEGLIHYALLLESSSIVTGDDKVSLEINRDKLLSMKDEKETEILTAIIKTSTDKLSVLYHNLPKEDRVNLDSLLIRFNQSRTFSEAWNYALRIKGYVYESLFAVSNGLRYTPEALKFKISDIIYLHAPDKYEQFQRASSKEPGIRDMKPDFFIIKDSKVSLNPIWRRWGGWAELAEKKKKLTLQEKDAMETIEYSNYTNIGSMNINADPSDLMTALIKAADNASGYYTISSNDLNVATNVSDEKKEGVDGMTVVGKELISEEIKRLTSILIIIEVGYQTEAETKVLTDYRKWRKLQEICRAIGLTVVVFTLSDSTKTLQSSSWLKKEHASRLASTLPYVFSLLYDNTPVGVAETSIADISTQKYRSALRSGHIVKTPITPLDSTMYFHKKKKEIFERPSSAVIPLAVQGMFLESIVNGSIMSNTSANAGMEAIIDCIPMIQSNVANGPMSLLCVSHRTNGLAIYGMFQTAFECLSKKGCLNIRNSISLLDETSARNELGTQTVFGHLKMLSEPQHTNHKCSIGNFPLLSACWSLNILSNLQEDNVWNKSETETSKDEKNPIDILCSAPISGRTGKSKQVKYRLLGLLGSISDRIYGVLRDSKGLVLSSYNSMMYKSTKKDSQEWIPRISFDDFKSTLIKEAERILSQSVVLLPSVVLSLTKLKKDLEACDNDYDMNMLLVRKYKSSSVIWGKNFIDSYQSMSDIIMNEDPILGILRSDSKRREKFEENKDERYGVVRLSQIDSHIQLCLDMLDYDIVTVKPTIINEYILNEIKDRYESTLYEGIDVVVERLLKLLLSVSGVVKLYLYSRLCETYINFTSEMSMSGYKIMKIKGTNLNLMCKVNSNKNTNSGCMLLNNEFSQCSQVFMMNRERAILGQSAFYCFIVCCLQVVQMQRCSLFLSNSLDDVMDIWESRMKDDKLAMKELLDYLLSSELSKASDFIKNQRNEFSFYKSRSTIPESLLGVYVLARFVTGFLTIWMPAILRNSRKNSKLFQMMRYPTMACIARYAYLKGMGTKLDSTCRNIDTFVIRNFIAVISQINLDNAKLIQTAIKESRSDNCQFIMSYTLIGFTCLSERQLLFDIYICHFYNKEDTDYAEGSIRVLEEMGDKHIEWEEDVKKYSKDPQNQYQRLRLLMGVKNMSMKEARRKITLSSSEEEDVLSDKSKEERSLGGRYRRKANKRLTSKSRIVETEEGDDTGSSQNSNTTKSSTWSMRTSDKVSQVTKRLTRPKETLLDTKILQSDIDLVTKSMKKHTFGVPEIVQIAVANMQSTYNDLTISQALKSPRNNEPISKISETTSILSKPNKKFDLKTAIGTIRSAQAMKVAKLINRLRRIDFADSKNARKFEKELMGLLGEANQNEEDFRENIKALATRYKNQKINWKKIFEMDLTNVLDSSNVNYLFSFVKSSWKEVRKVMKEMIDIKNMMIARKERIKKHKSFGSQEITRERNMQKEENLLIVEEYKKKLPQLLGKIDEMIKENLSLDLTAFLYDFLSLYINKQEYMNLKRQFPNTAFQQDETDLLQEEELIFKNHHKEILYCCLITIIYSELNVINIINDGGNMLLLRLNRLVTDDEKFEESDKFVENLMFPNQNISNWVIRQYKDSIFTEGMMQELNRFLQLILQGIDRPIATGLIGLEKDINSLTQLARMMKVLLAREQNSKMQNVDFHVVIADLIKSSLITARKLLGKRDKGIHLPRSVRSKVIYEMYKSAKEAGTTNVQELAFKLLTDIEHDFFGGLAPKAQIGGDRDLLVNEKKTKICIHVTESCSKSMMESAVRNDGLTNKKLKEEILKKSMQVMEQAHTQHGRVHKYGSSIRKDFCVAICILGDCSKWGPIHCCTYFSLLIQQLMKNYPDWVNYYKLIMLKSICKEIEIPIASIEKILRSFVNDPESKIEIKNNLTQDMPQLMKSFVKYVKKRWSNSKIATRMTEWYLAKGKSCFQPFNHMGQGIHHATSSLLGNICANLVDDITKIALKRYFPELVHSIEHAGSSDDFSKIILVSGQLSEKDFRLTSESFDERMIKVLNTMTGIMRCCQMLVSEKTIFSSNVAEFYSEFAFLDRVSPAPAKFILNQIINSSVTSPITLYQSTHVICQQAMYMGLPFITIFLVALFKQLIFIKNSEDIYNKQGSNFISSLAIFGRLYLPKYSQLTAPNSLIEDLLIVKKSLERIAITLHSENDGSVNDNESGKSIVRSVEVETVSEKTYGDSSDTAEDYLEVSPTHNEIVTIKDRLSISDILTALALRYYSQSDESIYSDEFSTLSKFDCQSLFTDAFTQLLPESVRQECVKLREFKHKEDVKPPDFSSNIGAASILIAKGSMTENYTFEMERLDQALNSKTVVWGLAGGIKNTSVSLHRQMLRAYLFDNKPELKGLNCWIKDNASRYMTDGDKKIPSERRVRFTDFLDKLCELEVEKTFNVGDIIGVDGIIQDKYNFLMNSNDCPCTIEVGNNGKQVIFFDLVKLMAANNLIEGLIGELTNKTFRTIKEIEHSSLKGYEPVTNIVTIKTKIWLMDRPNLLINNPNTIMAYFLNHNSLYEARPMQVDYPRLNNDVQSLANNFPRIFQTIRSIKERWDDSDTDETIRRKDITVLINLARMIGSSRNSSIDLYMFKNLRDSTSDNNPKNLITYSLMEGCQVIFDMKGMTQFHNELAYTLLGAIAIINWLPIDDSEKTNLLEKLLKINLKGLYKLRSECKSYEFIRDSLEISTDQKLLDTQVSGVLYAEAVRTKNRRLQDGLSALSQFSMRSSGHMRGTHNIEARPHLEQQGNLSQGNLTFSCKYGSATGLMLNGKLFLTLSSDDIKLVETLEILFLERQGLSTGDDSTGSLHNAFFRLLPSEAEDGKVPQRESTRYIILDRGGNYKMIKPHEMKFDKKNKKFLFVVRSHLVTTYKNIAKNTSTPRIKWGRNKIVIGYEVRATRVSIPESAERLQEKLNSLNLTDYSRKIEKKLSSDHVFEQTGMINLSSNAPLGSYTIIHCLLNHPLSLLPSIADVNELARENIKSKMSDDIEEIMMKEFQGSLENELKVNNGDLFIQLIDKFTRAEDIYCINMLSQLFGIGEVKLSFSGIEGGVVTDQGYWTAIMEENVQTSSLITTIKSIQLLVNNTIRRETVQTVLTCNMEENYIGIFETFSNDLSKINLYSGSLNVLLYLMNKWVLNYCSKQTEDRNKYTMLLNYLIDQSPLGFHTDIVSGCRFTVLESKDIGTLMIEFHFKGVAVGKDLIKKAFQKIRDNFPELLEPIRLSSEAPQNPTYFDNNALLKISISISDLTKNKDCFVFIGKLYRYISKRNEPEEHLWCLMDTLIQCCINDDYDPHILPEPLMNHIINRRRTGVLPDEVEESSNELKDYLNALIDEELEGTAVTTDHNLYPDLDLSDDDD